LGRLEFVFSGTDVDAVIGVIGQDLECSSVRRSQGFGPTTRTPGASSESAMRTANRSLLNAHWSMGTSVFATT
jgi:hypothetical protein